MGQDQEQEIMITIDEHVVFMAFQKTNCSLAFPWSKNIMDEHHVFFTFTFVCENTWRIQRSYAHENYIKHSGKQCKLFTAVSMEQENNGRATCFHGLHCS